MAVADYKGLVESIYISYFGRPADTLGLANFAAQLDAMKAPTTVIDLNAAYKSNSGLRTLIDSFGASAESTNLYGSDNVAFVSAIYQNVLNRSADFDGLVFWVTELNAGRLTKGNAALAITAGALENKSAQGLLDAQVIGNKVAIATNFTAAVDTADELAAYRGDAAAATARDMLKTVTATTSPIAFQSTVDATLATIVTNAIPTVITSLTTGIDAFTGTSGNDNFRAIVGTGATLTAFDSIDGGAGNNSLTVFDLDTTAGATATTLPSASITYKNIQTLNVQTANVKGASIDGTQIASLTALNVQTSVGPVAVTASGTTAVKVMDLAGAVTVNGGSTVDVTTNTAGGSTVTVNSAAGKTTMVSVHGGNGVTINDVATGSTADSIATVTLDGIAGSAMINSDVLTSLNLNKLGGNVTVNAAAGTRALNVALSGQTGGTVTDATATTVNVAALTAKSTVSLSAAAATAVNLAAGVDTTIASLTADAATAITVTGSGKVSVGAASLAALTSFNASANTGGVTITPMLGNGVAFTGGTGVDSISIGATTKAIAMGDGNDSVTLTGGALGTGGAVDGGAGTDTLAGTSALMAAQLGAATAAKITGFETIKVTDMLTGASSFDVSALVGAVNFTAANGVATGTTASVTGLGAGANVSILGAAGNNGTLDLSMKTDTASDVLNVTVNHDFTMGNTGAVNGFTTNISANAVETLNITSTGKGSVAAGDTPDSVNNNLVIKDAALVTLNLAGDQAVTFNTSAAQTKLAMIDASADTAGATINAMLSTAGLTIKGSATASNMLTGSASVDTIIGGAKADIITGGIGGDTLTGNGGNDTFVINNGDSTITINKADTITDFVANTYGAGTSGAVNSFGANGVAAAKMTGDVIQVTHATGVSAAITVGVYTNASDATTFLATASASEGVAQTIHAALNSSTGDLYMDINGDGVADLYVHLTGVTTLTAAAFLIV